jgi:transcriptional regulator with XRE-family HTH domain
METTAEGAIDGLGPKLRTLRRAKGYSLARVAHDTGVSRSLLSLIENGKNDLTVGRLIRLAAYYGISITDLLPEQDEADPEVVRRGDERHIVSGREKIDIFVLVPDGKRAMEPVIASYGVGGGTNGYLSFEAEQFIHVLEGTIELTFEGEKAVILREGDTAYFSATRPHKYKNAGRTIARALHARTPPS